MYLVWRMLLRTIWSCEWYYYPLWPDILIHFLFEISDPEPYIIYNLLQLNDGIIQLHIMWNETFNACVESQKYCSNIFALVITPQKYLQQSGISTYIYTISHGHINPVSYHIVRVYHFWANVHKAIYRCIHPVCIMCYAFTITEQIYIR